VAEPVRRDRLAGTAGPLPLDEERLSAPGLEELEAQRVPAAGEGDLAARRLRSVLAVVVDDELAADEQPRSRGRRCCSCSCSISCPRR
jgi:hypothetical protein